MTIRSSLKRLLGLDHHVTGQKTHQMRKGPLQIIVVLGFERQLHPVIRIPDPWIRAQQKIGVARKTLVEMLGDRALAGRCNRVLELDAGHTVN